MVDNVFCSRPIRKNAVMYTQRLADAMYYANDVVFNYFVRYSEHNGKGDYLDVTKDGHISWRPLGRTLTNWDGTTASPLEQLSVSGRVKGKPAKTIKAFLGPLSLHISDETWEKFSNNFLAIHSNDIQLDLVDGEDIRRLYRYDEVSLKTRSRELYNSCMRHEKCQPYLDLYVKNKNQVQMLVQRDTLGKVIARALVWKTDRGATVMDRVYGDNNAIARFQTHAAEQGWWWRRYNTYTYPNRFVIDGEEKTRTIRVTLEHAPIRYPWLDTFYFYAIDEGVLANTAPALKGRGDIVHLRNTDGGFQYPGQW